MSTEGARGGGGRGPGMERGRVRGAGAGRELEASAPPPPRLRAPLGGRGLSPRPHPAWRWEPKLFVEDLGGAPSVAARGFREALLTGPPGFSRASKASARTPREGGRRCVLGTLIGVIRPRPKGFTPCSGTGVGAQLPRPSAGAREDQMSSILPVGLGALSPRAGRGGAPRSRPVSLEPRGGASAPLICARETRLALGVLGQPSAPSGPELHPRNPLTKACGMRLAVRF